MEAWSHFQFSVGQTANDYSPYFTTLLPLDGYSALTRVSKLMPNNPVSGQVTKVNPIRVEVQPVQIGMTSRPVISSRRCPWVHCLFYTVLAACLNTWLWGMTA